MKPAYFDCHCDTLLETLRTGDGKPHGAHTTNLVAISAVGEGIRRLTNRGKLCDVAPTILSVSTI